MEPAVPMERSGERVLVGGVGYRWMGDASFGPVVADRLAELPRAPGVEVDDLGYGAHFVAQDLEAADPPYGRLVLVAGVERGRAPGTLQRTLWRPAPCAAEEIQERMREAGAGVVDLDHLLVIGHHFAALPPEVVLFELEPATLAGEHLSPQAAAALPGLLEVLARGGGEELGDRRGSVSSAGGVS